MSDTELKETNPFIDTNKLFIKREEYNNINLICTKLMGLQYSEDVSNLMSAISELSRLGKPTMIVVDVREMKSTMYKNINEIAQFVKNDIKNIKIYMVIYTSRSLADLCRLVAMFVRYKVINLTLDNYLDKTSRVNNKDSYIILVDANANNGGISEGDHFNPYNDLIKEYAKKLSDVQI